MRFTAKIFHRLTCQYPDKAPASVSQPPATTVYSPHFLFKFHRPVIELVMIDIIHICLNSLSIIALSVEHFPWKVRPYTLCYFAMFNQCYCLNLAYRPFDFKKFPIIEIGTFLFHVRLLARLSHYRPIILSAQMLLLILIR